MFLYCFLFLVNFEVQFYIILIRNGVFYIKKTIKFGYHFLLCNKYRVYLFMRSKWQKVVPFWWCNLEKNNFILFACGVQFDNGVQPLGMIHGQELSTLMYLHPNTSLESPVHFHLKIVDVCIGCVETSFPLTRTLLQSLPGYGHWKLKWCATWVIMKWNPLYPRNHARRKPILYVLTIGHSYTYTKLFNSMW